MDGEWTQVSVKALLVGVNASLRLPFDWLVSTASAPAPRALPPRLRLFRLAPAGVALPLYTTTTTAAASNTSALLVTPNNSGSGSGSVTSSNSVGGGGSSTAVIKSGHAGAVLALTSAEAGESVVSKPPPPNLRPSVVQVC
jgi:hypothetical protein